LHETEEVADTLARILEARPRFAGRNIRWQRETKAFLSMFVID
jgi:hypothetical protein